ncbi:hypothetical protein BOTBODRAFT_30688 [Botryobasidium botryosum FD-172 SS1]|uniref:Uncharacterized protein n=1 Tax=Botryobasidium botryosum (strain FD-172 SS1) TaxID=930990 RepID=A0A067MZ44_BOTB1|nr:hypothetical protein BOTBODRAFT_30688 [Botryobasidium botryosum FD-172 SS1]
MGLSPPARRTGSLSSGPSSPSPHSTFKPSVAPTPAPLPSTSMRYVYNAEVRAPQHRRSLRLRGQLRDAVARRLIPGMMIADHNGIRSFGISRRKLS